MKTKLPLFILFVLLTFSVYSQDGTNDSSFNSTDVGFGFGDGPNLKVICTAQQSDGKLIIGGEFTMYNGAPANYITRLNLDGTVDATFNPGTGANNAVKTIAIQSNGKILIGGSFTNFNGSVALHITRLNADGSIDNTFLQGPGNTDGDVNAIAIQTNGNIIIGGSFSTYLGFGRNKIAFLNANGSLGTIWNVSANNTINTIALQSDGKIIIGGSFTLINGIVRNRIARINVDGTLDTTFVPAGTGSNTGANNTVNAIAIQNDGKIIVGGYFTAYGGTTTNRILRLNSSGTRDTTFNPGGAGVEWDTLTIANDCAIFSVLIKSDGSILIGGNFWNYNGSNCASFVQLYNDGTKMPTYCFGNTFYNYSNTSPNNSESVRSILVQNDGKIILAGKFNNIRFHKYITRLENGSEDASFNPGTGVAFDNDLYGIKDLLVQADGKTIIMGTFHNYNGVKSPCIARLNTNGSLDTSFNTSSLDIDVFGSSISTIALQNDGKVLMYGKFNGTNSLIRLNTDGSKDTSFNPIFNTNAIVSAIKVQADGKILIGGGFTQVNGIARNNVARLNPDGSLDTTFNLTVGTISGIRAIETRNNGDIVIGGSFSAICCGANNLIIVSSTGGSALVTSLGIDPGGSISALAVRSDGQIFVGGNFTYGVPNTTYYNLYSTGGSSYNSNFALNAGLALNGPIYKIALQCDGKIIIAGGFTTFNGIARNGIARLNANGTLDTTFNPGTGGTSIKAMALQDDGKILIGGNFTSYNGIGRNRVARVLATDVITAQTAGTITGAVNVCKGSTSQLYMLPVVTGATSYVWTLPAGASIQTNYGNGIFVNFNAVNATSGNITAQAILPITKCHPINPISILPITVYSPITNVIAITGTNNVYIGSTYTYTVPLESNVTSYQWTLPTGAIGTSTTNSITVTYSINTVPGNITVRRLNVCGTSTDTILPITVNTLLGLNQIQKDYFVYYPNPVNNVVNFENNNPIKKITLFNLLGQVIQEKEINSLLGQLDMSKLPTGNYLLKVKTDNGVSTIKLVKN